MSLGVISAIVVVLNYILEMKYPIALIVKAMVILKKELKMLSEKCKECDHCRELNDGRNMCYKSIEAIMDGDTSGPVCKHDIRAELPDLFEAKGSENVEQDEA